MLADRNRALESLVKGSTLEKIYESVHVDAYLGVWQLLVVQFDLDLVPFIQDEVYDTYGFGGL